jgi:predicted DNA-binding protein with PD1-like motif
LSFHRLLMTGITTYTFRLRPGDDLKEGIQQFVQEHKIAAGWMVTCLGSLTEYHLRFANQAEGSTGSGHFEIVSLTGTLSINGSHLHACISDSSGQTIGGHLLSGCKVYTTAEVVVAGTDRYIFTRETDAASGYQELNIREPFDPAQGPPATLTD